MQLLAESSEEGRPAAGLGIVPGRSVRLGVQPESPVPRIGWADARLRDPEFGLDGSWPEADFYFAHSYHLIPRDYGVVLATTQHGEQEIVAALSIPGCVGYQFHPEKSGAAGRIALESALRTLLGN